MIDPKDRSGLEWEFMQIAFKFQHVDIEEVITVLRMCWEFGPELQEHLLRGNLFKKAG